MLLGFLMEIRESQDNFLISIRQAKMLLTFQIQMRDSQESLNFKNLRGTVPGGRSGWNRLQPQIARVQNHWTFLWTVISENIGELSGQK